MDQTKNRISSISVYLIDITSIICSFIAVHGRYSDISVLLTLLSIYTGIYLLQNITDRFFLRGIWEELGVAILENVCLMAAYVLLLFFMKKADDYSRFSMVKLFSICFGMMFSIRSIYKWYMLNVYKVSRKSRKVAVIALEKNAADIIKSFKKNCVWYGQVTALILTDVKEQEIGKVIEGIPVRANRDSMFNYAKEAALDEVFIHGTYDNDIHMIEEFENMGLTVHLNIEVFDLSLHCRKKELIKFGDYYAVSFAPINIDYKKQMVKRLMDIVGALLGLLITAIVTVFLAPVLLIESPGPLFFCQTRVGRNGRKFKFYKFRSMYMDAEERKKELMKYNKMNGLMFKIDNDPRITRVGKFIRKTSIDELPQFYNVLKGDMSLVGTRPPTVDEFEQYAGHYKRRLSFMPGITGVWQVYGRSNITEFEEVLKMDLEYIDNWSIRLDIKILCRTFYVALFGNGAV